MKIPANWRKPDWKSWGRKVWQRTRVYAVLVAVVALGIGLYGVYLMQEVPKWRAESLYTARESVPAEGLPPAAKPLPEAPASEPAPKPSAADITPVRVPMPADEAEAEPAPEEVAEVEDVAEPEDVPAAASTPSQPPADEPEAPAEEALPEASAPILEQAPRWVYVDPQPLLAAGWPCRDASPSRGYGFTFDERYGDYRYHNGVSFAIASDRSVYAVRGGTVLSIDSEQQEVIISDGSWQCIYRPVGDLAVSIGQSVSAGRALGNVPQDQTEFFFAVQQKQ